MDCGAKVIHLHVFQFAQLENETKNKCTYSGSIEERPRVPEMTLRDVGSSWGRKAWAQNQEPRQTCRRDAFLKHQTLTSTRRMLTYVFISFPLSSRITQKLRFQWDFQESSEILWWTMDPIVWVIRSPSGCIVFFTIVYSSYKATVMTTRPHQMEQQ